MHNLQRTSLVLMAMLTLTQRAFATGVDHGELVAAIRSADYPCQQVLDLQDTGDNAWHVRCNSGTYQVTRDADGQFSVAETN